MYLLIFSTALSPEQGHGLYWLPGVGGCQEAQSLDITVTGSLQDLQEVIKPQFHHLSVRAIIYPLLTHGMCVAWGLP